MKFVGLLLVIGCTIGGYMWAGGHLGPILKAAPYEILIIMGCAIGAFVIANSTHTIKSTIKNLNCYLKPEAHNKESYLELLSVMFMVFKLARTKGWLALESHIENPHDSELFKQFPGFHHDHHAITFLCDYLRIISLGNENPHELEALMDMEIETITADKMHPSHAVQSMADGIPALGIVAAVLGVIKTMGSITEPPEVLGKMIGGALVGTFLGVFLAYGFVAPLANRLGGVVKQDLGFYDVIKSVLIAGLHQHATNLCVEVGRQTVPEHVRPSFDTLETALRDLKKAA